MPRVEVMMNAAPRLNFSFAGTSEVHVLQYYFQVIIFKGARLGESALGFYASSVVALD